jgi:biotin synthase
MDLMRHDWDKKEILDIYSMPLLELVYKAASVHRQANDPSEVQISSLMSIKTGGCSEDCAYCPQSARYQTGIHSHKLLSVEHVTEAAKKAKKAGATRFCMGAAWREVKEGEDFDSVLEMVKAVRKLDMEVCCTLGMLTEGQAKKLEKAGLYAYNHNIDTSPEYYDKIITTREFRDRLNTLENIRKTSITVCCGGIIGMGESPVDRISMLQVLSSLDPHPESVPINSLISVKGTSLEGKEPVSVWDMVRMVATARILMPKSVVRLSAGRVNMSKEAQALCFLAGANSIFIGEKLLTQKNPDIDEDKEMFKLLGLKNREAFKQLEVSIKQDI